MEQTTAEELLETQSSTINTFHNMFFSNIGYMTPPEFIANMMMSFVSNIALYIIITGVLYSLARTILQGGFLQGKVTLAEAVKSFMPLILVGVLISTIFTARGWKEVVLDADSNNRKVVESYLIVDILSLNMLYASRLADVMAHHLMFGNDWESKVKSTGQNLTFSNIFFDGKGANVNQEVLDGHLVSSTFQFVYNHNMDIPSELKEQTKNDPSKTYEQQMKEYLKKEFSKPSSIVRQQQMLPQHFVKTYEKLSKIIENFSKREIEEAGDKLRLVTFDQLIDEGVSYPLQYSLQSNSNIPLVVKKLDNYFYEVSQDYRTALVDLIVKDLKKTNKSAIAIAAKNEIEDYRNKKGAMTLTDTDADIDNFLNTIDEQFKYTKYLVDKKILNVSKVGDQLKIEEIKIEALSQELKDFIPEKMNLLGEEEKVLISDMLSKIGAQGLFSTHYDEFKVDTKDNHHKRVLAYSITPFSISELTSDTPGNATASFTANKTKKEFFEAKTISLVTDVPKTPYLPITLIEETNNLNTLFKQSLTSKYEYGVSNYYSILGLKTFSNNEKTVSSMLADLLKEVYTNVDIIMLDNTKLSTDSSDVVNEQAVKFEEINRKKDIEALYDDKDEKLYLKTKSRLSNVMNEKANIGSTIQGNSITYDLQDIFNVIEEAREIPLTNSSINSILSLLELERRNNNKYNYGLALISAPISDFSFFVKKVEAALIDASTHARSGGKLNTNIDGFQTYKDILNIELQNRRVFLDAYSKWMEGQLATANKNMTDFIQIATEPGNGFENKTLREIQDEVMPLFNDINNKEGEPLSKEKLPYKEFHWIDLGLYFPAIKIQMQNQLNTLLKVEAYTRALEDRARIIEDGKLMKESFENYLKRAKDPVVSVPETIKETAVDAGKIVALVKGLTAAGEGVFGGVSGALGSLVSSNFIGALVGVIKAGVALAKGYVLYLFYSTVIAMAGTILLSFIYYTIPAILWFVAVLNWFLKGTLLMVIFPLTLAMAIFGGGWNRLVQYMGMLFVHAMIPIYLVATFFLAVNATIVVETTARSMVPILNQQQVTAFVLKKVKEVDVTLLGDEGMRERMKKREALIEKKRLREAQLKSWRNGELYHYEKEHPWKIGSVIATKKANILEAYMAYSDQKDNFFGIEGGINIFGENYFGNLDTKIELLEKEYEGTGTWLLTSDIGQKFLSLATGLMANAFFILFALMVNLSIFIHFFRVDNLLGEATGIRVDTNAGLDPQQAVRAFGANKYTASY